MVGRKRTERIKNGVNQACLVAIAGASGAGKTWLAKRLEQALFPNAGRLSLDDFYKDRSHLSAPRRARINFDHPRAIDWPVVEEVLKCSLNGNPARVPEYDFARHARNETKSWAPKSVVLMDGLWLFRRPSIRKLFNLRIFIKCPVHLCQKRRVERDVRERGRTPQSVRRQFREAVLPMQKRYVAPQIKWADLVLQSPLSSGDLDTVTQRVKELLKRRVL